MSVFYDFVPSKCSVKMSPYEGGSDIKQEGTEEVDGTQSSSGGEDGVHGRCCQTFRCLSPHSGRRRVSLPDIPGWGRRGDSGENLAGDSQTKRGKATWKESRVPRGIMLMRTVVQLNNGEVANGCYGGDQR